MDMALAEEAVTRGAEARPQGFPVSVAKLSLSNYRNYYHLSLELEAKPVVLTGANGAGKTNLLEAISFLAPGRGMRNARLERVDRVEDDRALCWAVSAQLQMEGGLRHIGTGRDPQSPEAKRIIKIDHDTIRGQNRLAEILTVMWQVPQMDGLFIGPASDRRRFMDRMSYHFHPEHARYVNQYEHAMRERMRLLQQGGDSYWISTLEQRMSEAAVTVAAARNETVTFLQHSITQAPTGFPKPVIAIEGEIEATLPGRKALELEDEIRKKLHDSRSEDRRSGRTNYGVHRSDFLVEHEEKQMPAANCSTGEQKALLLSLVLAEARAKVAWKQDAPILLLDEVVAHLDSSRREALFKEILALGLQVWMTGTEPTLFEDIASSSNMLYVEQGEVSQHHSG